MGMPFSCTGMGIVERGRNGWMGTGKREWPRMTAGNTGMWEFLKYWNGKCVAR